MIFEDSDYLKPVFYTLAINAESINKAYGSLAEFAEKFNLQGVTNGRLYLIAFMSAYSKEYQMMQERILQPAHFKINEDYIYFEEELFNDSIIHGEKNAYRELSCTKGLSWIKSIVLPCGNYVWHTDNNLSMKEKKREITVLSAIYLRKKEICKNKPLLLREDDTYYYYKVSFSEELCPVPKFFIEAYDY